MSNAARTFEAGPARPRSSVVTVFHVPGTRSSRVVWALEELGVPYTVEMVPFTKEFRDSPRWRELNPVGKIPAMVFENGYSMFESGAMVQHLIDRYGGCTDLGTGVRTEIKR